MPFTYVATQPIYNNDLVIYAYQLLFRSSEENEAVFDDADHATSELILNSLTDIGLDKLVGNHKAFINFTRNFILGEYPIPAIKRKIIPELQSGTSIDDSVIEALNALSIKGFTVSMPESVYLDHFSSASDYPYIVKFDIRNYKKNELQEAVDKIKRDNVRVLADKIETPEEYAMCTTVEFDFYQGFFFCHPSIVKGRGIAANKLQLVRILHKLQDDDTDSNELDTLISSDINLSYRLLRYANSSHLGINKRIESIQHAVTLLGWNSVKMITTLLVLSSIDDKVPELFLFGLIRAKMCEQMTDSINSVDKNMAFTAGLLSIIDALLDVPMEDVLAQLTLNEKLTQALLNYEGELGHLLHDAIAYIHIKPEEANLSGISGVVMRDLYIKSLIWANSMAPSFTS